MELRRRSILISGSLYGLSQPGLVLGLFARRLDCGPASGNCDPAMAEESFAFAGSPVRLTRQYTVGVVTQPTGLTLGGKRDLLRAGPITDVRVTCSPGKVVGGSVSGLYAGRSVALELADQLLVATNSDAGAATVNVDFFFPGTASQWHRSQRCAYEISLWARCVQESSSNGAGRWVATMSIPCQSMRGNYLHQPGRRRRSTAQSRH